MRGREVEARGGVRFDGLVAVELRTVVDRDGVHASRRRANERDRTAVRGVVSFPVEDTVRK